LLHELCVDLGFCLPRDDQLRLLVALPDDVDEFTGAIMVADGLEPIYGADLRRAVRARVAKHFQAASQ
jgi:hypothetical protein